MPLQGNLKLDVPAPTDFDDIYGGTTHKGIQIEATDLKQDPNNPAIYTADWEWPSVSITVTVQKDGSTTIATEPRSIIIENTLHV
jgi:hypothetical protein